MLSSSQSLTTIDCHFRTSSHFMYLSLLCNPMSYLIAARDRGVNDSSSSDLVSKKQSNWQRSLAVSDLFLIGQDTRTNDGRTSDFFLLLPHIKDFHSFAIYPSHFFVKNKDQKSSFTMRFYQLLLSVALLNFSTSVKAFNARPLRSTRLAKATGPLKVGVALDWNEHDLDEAFLMQRAQVCANSDSCTLQDARTCLDDILHVQSGCVGGTILGSVCDNVDVAAELVAKLRNKIQEKTKEAM